MTVYASPVSQTSYPPVYAPAPPAPSGLAAPVQTGYQGLLDQLHLAGQTTMTVAPPPVAPTFQIPILSDLLGNLRDLLSHLFSPAPPQPTTPSSTRRATDLVISSFNVLGSSHTVPGAEHPDMAPGTVRIRSAIQLLSQHQVDVVGFQELQVDQTREFQKLAGDRYAIYPGLQLGRGPSVNSIAWRKDKWDLVKANTVAIPYFDGHTVRMPVVLLRNKETGQEAYFTNFHNPATTKKHHDQERYRDQATDIEIALVKRLEKEGKPVFLTGDMNERDEYYDRMTSGTDMVASNEGPKGQRPKAMGIDWIFGSPGITFSDYTRDRGALVKQTTDHPMVVSHARIARRP